MGCTHIEYPRIWWKKKRNKEVEKRYIPVKLDTEGPDYYNCD